MDKNDTIFFDKKINRKSSIVNNSLQSFEELITLFSSIVEVSDSGTCNRSCSFYPGSYHKYLDIKNFITEKFHNKIFIELSNLNYSELFYSQCVLYPRN